MIFGRKHVENLKSAFTLVELLVVISIIALLLSILMPSLSRVREQARSIVCATNLRQCGLGIVLYAENNRGNTVPNFILYSQYMPYMIRDNNGDTPKNLGYLYAQGYLKEPKLYYCPSASRPAQKFDTEENPWWENHAKILPDVHTYSSYYYYIRVPNSFWNRRLSDSLEARGLASRYETWVKLDKLKNKALLSDTVFYPDRYPHYVKKGFNVAYGDGSVRFWRDGKGYFKDIAQRQPYLSDVQIYEVFNMFDKN